MEELKQRIREAGEKIVAAWRGLKEDGKIGGQEALDLIAALVAAAQEISPERGTGALKHKAVRAVWEELDRQYHLVEKLDSLIKLPAWAEPFDGWVIRKFVDLLISAAAAGLKAPKRI